MVNGGFLHLATERPKVLGFACAIAVAALAAFAAPAPATELGWQDASADLPASVDLNAVAADSALVLAVGRDTQTGGPVAVRLGTGTAALETLPAAGAQAVLVDVALAAGGAWAVGWRDTGTERHALALRMTADGTWTEVAVPVSAAPLRSVTLAADGNGYAGDEEGALFTLRDGVVAAAPATVAPPGDIGALNSLALRTSDGLAAASGMYRLAEGDAVVGRTLQRMTAPPLPNRTSPVSVAAGDETALAVSDAGPCADRGGVPADAGAATVWRLDDQTASWVQQGSVPLSGSVARTALCDVHVAADGTEALAGSWDGKGAVWRRSTGGSWLRDGALGDAGILTGVAARSAGELWAVGPAGTVAFYGPVPEPEPVVTPTPEVTPTPDVTPTPTPEPTVEATPITQSNPDPQPIPDGNAAIQTTGQVVLPAGTTPAATPPVRRLLSGVQVRRLRRRLRIHFRLSAPASVEFVAIRRGRRVGRAKTRILGPGRWKVVLRYRGRRAPSRLSISVRPKNQTQEENR